MGASLRRPAAAALAERLWRRSGSMTAAAVVSPAPPADTPVRSTRRHRMPRRLAWASRIDAWPPACWLALQALALWPVIVWAARRLADGSDEPLGLVALALLALAAASGRLACQPFARPRWLGAAALLTALATAAIGVLPWLALSVIAALALGCAWAAWRIDGTPRLPVLGLLLLALPVVASLQFYAGYPLRVLTAHASAVLLQLAGLAAEVNGATVLLDGRLVIVDAPCSGVQLAWLGYCAACAAALWNRLGDTRFVTRLPGVGVAVLAGNVLRNTLLVAKEGGALALPSWSHDAIGLAALAGVAIAVTALMRPETPHAPR